jgi:hypothetical protein
MSCRNVRRRKLLCTEQIKGNNLEAAEAFPEVEIVYTFALGKLVPVRLLL